MEIRDLLTRGVTLIVDPRKLKTSLDDFLASYGGYLEYLVAVAKDTTGRVFYPSKIAPADEEFPTFFSELIDITRSVGIKAGAYLNVFADAFFAMDDEFKTYMASGDAIQAFVCPNKPAFTQHMITVVKEVAETPIQTLFLGNLGYSHSRFCYCSDCRNEFTEYADLRHTFHLADSSANPALFKQWIDWRVEKLTNVVQQLVTAATEVKAELQVIPTIPIDPEAGFTLGVREQLGLDLEAIAALSKNIAIEVLPWTPILPDPGSKDFNLYIENLDFISKLRKTGVEFVMTHWVLESEVEYNRAKALADAAGIDKIFTMLGYPANFQAIREIRLGLGR